MRRGILIEIILGIVLLVIIGIFFSKRMNIKEPKISPLVLSKVGTQQHEIEEIIWEEIPEKKLENSRIIEESQIEEKTLYVEQELLIPDITVDKADTQAFRATVENKPKYDVTVKTITHKVQSGDSLYRIAGKYYDDPTMWKKIYKANEETIEGKDLLRKGQILIIPQ